MFSSKMASMVSLLVGTFAQDNFLSKKDLGRLLSEDAGEGTFAAARPGSCCTVEPHTRLRWSEFENSNGFLQNGVIVVPCGYEVTVDESVDVEVGLQVHGSLTFQDGIDIRLTVDYVFVCGRFTIGTPDSPHQSDLEIVLRTGRENFMWAPHGHDDMPGHHHANFGKAPFVTYGGSTYIHGAQCGQPSWTRLRSAVEPVIDPTDNIASGGAAQQSSFQDSRHSATRGTDGGYHWRHNAVQTRTETNPWWSLVLDEPVNVMSVVLEEQKHSSQRLYDATVLVSSEPCVQGALCTGHVCSFKNEFRRGTRGHMRVSYFLEFDCEGATGQYVHLQLEGEEQKLWFGEMEVYQLANSGSFDLSLQHGAGVSWQPGDRIVITPSERSSDEYDHDLVVESVDHANDVVRVRGSMTYVHDGCDTSDPDCWQAAEVASLSRNVRIRGEEGCVSSRGCGHFMIAHTNTGFVCGVNFENLGQEAVEGRYPLHMHMAGDSPELVLRSNVLSFNHNRGIVLHGTNQALVDNNVIYKSNGHLFMLEDAIEMENRIFNNLFMDPSPMDLVHDEDGNALFDCSHSHDSTFICPNRGDQGPNAFWISNPGNYFEGNVAIAPGNAFFIETRHVFGLTRRKFSRELSRVGLGNGKIKNRVKLGSWKNNLAHSSGMGMGNYPRMSHPDGSPVVYEGFTAWSCDEGQRARGGVFHFVNSRLINNMEAAVSGFVSKIRITNSQLQGNQHRSSIRGYPLVSAPMVIKQLSLSSEAAIRREFEIDDATKAWTLEHGLYDWDAFKEWPRGSVGVLFEE